MEKWIDKTEYDFNKSWVHNQEVKMIKHWKKEKTRVFELFLKLTGRPEKLRQECLKESIRLSDEEDRIDREIREKIKDVLINE